MGLKIDYEINQIYSKLKDWVKILSNWASMEKFMFLWIYFDTYFLVWFRFFLPKKHKLPYDKVDYFSETYQREASEDSKHSAQTAWNIFGLKISYSKFVVLYLL